ncbi:MAG: hypothetical protein AABW72_00755 [archaeon]
MPKPRKPTVHKTKILIPKVVALQTLQKELVIARAIKSNYHESPVAIVQMLNGQGHSVDERDVRKVWIKLRKASRDVPVEGIRAEVAGVPKAVRRPRMVRTRIAKTTSPKFRYAFRRKELLGKLFQLGLALPSTVSYWRPRVLLLEKEGFWKPLAIRDLNGLLNEIERPDIGDPQYLSFERESGKRRRKVMEIFLNQLGGKTEGNRYSANVRGIKAAALTDNCLKQMRIGRAIIYETLEELISMGILRRTNASKGIVMILMPKQMTDYYQKWLSTKSAVFEAAEEAVD